MENELIIKKNKKGKLHIIISAIILLIGLAFIGFGVMNANDKKNNAQNLVEFGWNNSTTDELVYLDIAYEPVQLTEEIDGEAYYILLDNDYYYIAYMKLDKAEKIKAPARVTGIIPSISIPTFLKIFESFLTYSLSARITCALIVKDDDKSPIGSVTTFPFSNILWFISTSIKIFLSGTSMSFTCIIAF